MAAAAFSSMSAGGWIDLACAVVLGLSVLVGAVRGLTGQAARLFGFVAGLSCTAAVLPALRSSVFSGGGRSDAVLAFAAAVVAGAAAGLVVRALVARFLRLIVGQPGDAALGALLSGAVCILAMSFVFAFLWLVPLKGVRHAVFEESVAGGIVGPVAVRAAGIQSAGGM